jgi:hypothetical protein
MPRALMKERNLAALKSVPKFGMTGSSSATLELDKYLIGRHLTPARIGAVDPPRPAPVPMRKAPISTVSRRRVPAVRKWNERPVRVCGVVVRGGGFARRCRIGGAVLHLSHRSVTRRAARGAPQIDLHEQSSPPEAQLNFQSSKVDQNLITRQDIGSPWLAIGARL